MITDALKDIQVCAAGETPTAEEASDCLRKFNRMMAGLKLESIDVDWRTLTLDDQFPLPDEHERGCVALLAVEVSPSFGREVDPAVAVTAERSRGLLQAAYTDIKTMKLDGALRDRLSSETGFDFNRGS